MLGWISLLIGGITFLLPRQDPVARQ